MLKKLIFISAVALLVTACTSVSLQGAWMYQPPTGAAVSVDIADFSRDELYVKGGKNLISGIYRRNGEYLTLVRPDDPRAQGLKLRIVNERKLMVVDEPPTSLTGQKHLSGELVR